VVVRECECGMVSVRHNHSFDIEQGNGDNAEWVGWSHVDGFYPRSYRFTDHDSALRWERGEVKPEEKEGAG